MLSVFRCFGDAALPRSVRSAMGGWGARFKSSSVASADGSSSLTFSSIAKSSTTKDEDISNVFNPLLQKSAGGSEDSGPVGKARELPVKYVLSCVFGKNNTHFTYSAVVEDVNYLRNNPGLSYNEAFLYYLKPPQKVKFAISTGCLGFRKAARGEYEAAFQTATKAFQMIQAKKLLNKEIEVVMKDFGKGRAAFVAALNGKEGNAIRKNIIRVSDKTTLKFGGVRSPRIRRL